MVARKTSTRPASKTQPPAKTQPPVEAEEKETPQVEEETLTDLSDLLLSDDDTPQEQESDGAESETQDSASQEQDEETGLIYIRVLQPNFIAFGRSWQAGQVLAVSRRVYEQQETRDGKNWLDDRNDPDTQKERFGSVVFEGAEPTENSVEAPVFV